ncbi:MAG: hypothetical protein IT382_22815 [Deltaproteobacteria bacterium]|nr:hypothetical protein [Deltaproteobacteria bacterium]
MTTDLEREARGKSKYFAKRAFESGLITADMEQINASERCFYFGYLAAATLREKEIEELKARNTELHIQNRMMYLQNFGTVEAGQEKEIATLRARVATVEGMLKEDRSELTEFCWLSTSDPDWSEVNKSKGWERTAVSHVTRDGRFHLFVAIPPIPVPETKEKT